jgi:hypothetical protein
VRARFNADYNVRFKHLSCGHLASYARRPYRQQQIDIQQSFQQSDLSTAYQRTVHFMETAIYKILVTLCKQFWRYYRRTQTTLTF